MLDVCDQGGNSDEKMFSYRRYQPILWNTCQIHLWPIISHLSSFHVTELYSKSDRHGDLGLEIIGMRRYSLAYSFQE